jgi:ankyrin repeat protein
MNAVLDKDTDTLQKYLVAGCESLIFDWIKLFFLNINSGFPPDQSDPVTKTTALHIAVESANYRAIQILLHAGAQVNLCDSSLST